MPARAEARDRRWPERHSNAVVATVISALQERLTTSRRQFTYSGESRLESRALWDGSSVRLKEQKTDRLGLDPGHSEGFGETST